MDRREPADVRRPLSPCAMKSVGWRRSDPRECRSSAVLARLGCSRGVSPTKLRKSGRPASPVEGIGDNCPASSVSARGAHAAARVDVALVVGRSDDDGGAARLPMYVSEPSH